MAPDSLSAVDEDPIIEAQIQRTLARFRHLLPHEHLPAFREMLSLYLNTDPDAAPLVDQLRRAPGQKSGTVEQESAELERALARRSPRAGGGRR